MTGSNKVPTANATSSHDDHVQSPSPHVFERTDFGTRLALSLLLVFSLKIERGLASAEQFGKSWLDPGGWNFNSRFRVIEVSRGDAQVLRSKPWNLPVLNGQCHSFAWEWRRIRKSDVDTSKMDGFKLCGCGAR